MAGMERVNNSAVLEMNGILNYTNTIVCYQPSSITMNGVWQNQNPLNFSLPIFILQLMIIVGTTKLTIFILKPLRQPRIVCELLSGLLLGPSGFGAIDWIGKNIFPLKSVMVLETMGNIGLLYYLFLVGIEMDITLIKRSSRQTLAVAAFSFFVPFAIYTGTTVLVLILVYEFEVSAIDIIYQGVTVSFTAYPVVSRILVELKLFNTELGKKAMSAALIVDLFAWSLVTVLVSEATFTDIHFFFLVISTVGFVLICFFTIRPFVMWIIKCTPEGENFNDFYICLILTAVIIFSFIGSVIGSPNTFGAFVIGLMIPNGPLGTVLLEKLEDFVTGILLPICFTTTSFRIEITTIFASTQLTYTAIACGVLLLANVSKVLSTFLMGLYFDMQMHEALSLGLLLNTKGVLNLIFFFMGLRTKVFDVNLFSINIIFMIVLMMITTPTIAALYKTSRQFISLNRMSLQMLKLNASLKILMCVHTPQNVSGMINLLEVSHANEEESRIDVYAIHLVELTARASSMLIVHNAQKSQYCNVENNTQPEHIIKAFNDYARKKTNINIQPLTIISPYLTMHEDICNLAEDKHIALIVLPFHKQQTVDGGMKSINPSLHHLNQNVLANAPCSIGILIDRGLGGSVSHVSHHNIAVIFIGGSDDREALTYGWRMIEHPCVKLTVIRFILGGDDDTKPTIIRQTHDEETHKVVINIDRETQLDDEYIGDFKLRTFGDKAIVYKEMVVNNAEETVSAIRGMDDTHDFYIVGRGQGVESPLTAGLTEFSESPELGAIGDLLASSDFATTISILVMQHYICSR